jgi:hypothetical protein
MMTDPSNGFEDNGDEEPEEQPCDPGKTLESIQLSNDNNMKATGSEGCDRSANTSSGQKCRLGTKED